MARRAPPRATLSRIERAQEALARIRGARWPAVIVVAEDAVCTPPGRASDPSVRIVPGADVDRTIAELERGIAQAGASTNIVVLRDLRAPRNRVGAAPLP